MPAYQSESDNDLLMTTLRQLNRLKFTDLQSDLQDFVAFRHLMKKHKVTVQDGGPGVQWDVLVRNNNSARNVGLYEADELNIIDGMVQAYVNWRFTTGNYAIDKRILAQNAGSSKIVDILQVKRIQGLAAYVEKMEDNFWSFPLATDDKTPLGLPYWITKNATEGFNGGIPSGYTTVAGLSPTTYPRWNNYSGTYTNVTAADLMTKWRRMGYATNFRSPVDGTPTLENGEGCGYYCNRDTILQLEDLVQSQNENIGTSLNAYEGKVMFNRAPVTYVPKLDIDTTNPVYAIDWSVFKINVLKDWWMKETRISDYPGNHNVTAVFIDSAYLMCCYNRRKCGVLATAATYPA